MPSILDALATSNLGKTLCKVEPTMQTRLCERSVQNANSVISSSVPYRRLTEPWLQPFFSADGEADGEKRGERDLQDETRERDRRAAKIKGRFKRWNGSRVCFGSCLD